MLSHVHINFERY